MNIPRINTNFSVFLIQNKILAMLALHLIPARLYDLYIKTLIITERIQKHKNICEFSIPDADFLYQEVSKHIHGA